VNALKIGNSSVSGYAWTATDTVGNGSWQNITANMMTTGATNNMTAAARIVYQYVPSPLNSQIVVGNLEFQVASTGSGGSMIGNNTYFDATDYRARASGTVERILFGSGEIKFAVSAGSETAGAIPTMVNSFQVHNSGVSVAATGYMHFGTTIGGTGYGFWDDAGTLKWKNSGGSWQIFGTGGGGMSNPMTTLGDIITGGASGTPGRLAVGAANKVLGVNTGGTNVEWQNRKFIIPVSGGASYNPTDAQTVYFTIGAQPLNTADVSRVYFHTTGTITRAQIAWMCRGTAGSNENVSVYIRINNTTDYLVATIGSTATLKNFVNNSLSIAVTPSDYFEIKVVQPTWTTNPTAVYWGGTLLLE
jgi:hypothetical protein